MAVLKSRKLTPPGQRLASTLWLLLGCLFSQQTYASTVSFKIVDQFGKPVENAVISTPGQGEIATGLAPAVMDQVDKQFSPRVLVIQKNQRVSFPNSDNIRHHVYSFSAPKPFEIRLFNNSSMAPLLFDKPGIVALGCNIHDQMIGYIYIAENEITGLSDENGLVSLDTSSDTLFVWHAKLSANNAQRNKIKLDQIPDGQNQIITLQLLTVQEEPVKSKFGSGKFGSKGN